MFSRKMIVVFLWDPYKTQKCAVRAERTTRKSFRATGEKRLLTLSYPPVRPSVRKYQRGSKWTDFHEIWYWKLLRQSVDARRVWL
jgi:hypothetical protein